MYFLATYYCTSLPHTIVFPATYCCTSLPHTVVLPCHILLYFSATYYCTSLPHTIVLPCHILLYFPATYYHSLLYLASVFASSVTPWPYLEFISTSSCLGDKVMTDAHWVVILGYFDWECIAVGVRGTVTNNEWTNIFLGQDLQGDLPVKHNNTIINYMDLVFNGKESGRQHVGITGNVEDTIRYYR